MKTSHVSRFAFYALAVLTTLLTTAWSPAPQSGEISVVGQIINGTPGHAVPADLAVTLHTFAEAQETGKTTITVAADGSFHFSGIMPEGEETCVVSVVYQDVIYYSELGIFETGQTELQLPVTIYETTEDPAAILVTQLHLFMTGTGERLQIGEYYLVSNTGDRTYVGAEDPETKRRITLTFTLPEGAENLHFDDAEREERYLEWGNGFADTAPIWPGTATSDVLFNYELPYREGLQVERSSKVPVASVVLVLPNEGMALEGDGIIFEGVIDTQMGSALSYTAGPLDAGQPLAFTLVAQPQEMPSAPTGTVPARSAAQETAIGLVTLAAALVVSYLLWRSPTPGPLPAQARPLVAKIAALDADFEAGQVREEKYRQEREMLKRQIRSLLEQQ